ncbi:MAG: NYN domain-containing protein [Hespellia sp.]|nr:NYN domain-containing protein [Hespellia sp.]
MEERFALLIDADNVSAKYIKPILDELSKYGNVTYKRIYGDWTSTHNASWKEILLQNSITPIQQYSYTQGKNATDSAMIIDAMDILYTSSVEGFCLVSSDSDFTKLASRLRESGRKVIGMGEDKTPVPFRKACDIFTTLELLLEDNSMDTSKVIGNAPIFDQPAKIEGKQKEPDIVSREQIEADVIKIITENQNHDRETRLSEVGNRLVKLYPDFDVRRYGYSLLSKFLETFSKLKLIQKGTIVSVMLYEDEDRKESVEEYIIKQVKAGGKQGVDLGALGNRIHGEFRDFKVRDYGYSQFKQYVRSIQGIRLEEEGEQIRAYFQGKNS